MSDIKQEIGFVEIGVDSDTDSRYIQGGDCTLDNSNLNILVSEDGAIGTITNSKGNTLSVDINDHLLLLADTYTTLGSFYNRLTRKAYYIVLSSTYDSGGGVYLYDNKLFCFNEDSETLDLIFTDTKNYFGLDLNYPMRDMDMLGDWLYFNPRASEPKMIDVVMAYNYTTYPKYDNTSTYIYGQWVTFFGGVFSALGAVSAGETPATAVSKWNRVGDCYRDDPVMALDSEFRIAFNVIKMAPLQRPLIVVRSDSSVKVNNLRAKIFRFSYRYKYFDNSYSKYSAYSDITLPEVDEFYNGEIFGSVYANNTLRIYLSPHSPSLVKEIELVFQQTNSDWVRAAIINRQEQSKINYLTTPTFYVDFYNNESYIPVDDTEVAKIYDSVAPLANSQAIINKNILAYGGVTEGFDNLAKENAVFSFTPIGQSITIPLGPGTTLRNNITSGDITLVTTTDGYGNIIYGEKIDLTTWHSGTLHAGDTYTITIDSKTQQYTLVSGDAVSPVNLAINLRTFLNYWYPTYNTELVDGTNIQIFAPLGSHRLSFVDQSLFSTAGTPIVELTKKRGFKTGAIHPFCIYYYDQSLRRWDAFVPDDMRVYVPMFMEDHSTYDSTDFRFVIAWEVGHLPPAGAKYWRWGYAGNSLCSYFVQYVITSVSGSGNSIIIDITPLQTLKTTEAVGWNQFPNSIIDAYVWQEGDRIRFLTEEGTGTALGAVIDGVYDSEIIKQDDTANTLYIQDFDDFAGLNVGVGSLIEIYRPKKSVADASMVYYEFGDIMPILEDSLGVMVHSGQDGLHNQDTQTGARAMGTFDSGDVYHIVRTPSQPINSGTPTTGFFHESMWYSDFYSSTDWDKGKIGIETSFGKRSLNVIRYSNQYLQDTQINGLSTFEGTNLKEINDIYGKIVAVYEMGDTLRVYQERKASSILIGRTEYMDANGQTTVAISDRVLGAIRYSPTNYSTVYPESIARNNRCLYGFDVYNGVMWRDTVNGIFPISGRYAEAGSDQDYKMMSYFKQKSKALMVSGVENTSVMSVWDEEYKMLYVTFKDNVNAANNETIAFHEPSNRWVSFYSLSQTLSEGYNTPLHLSYEVVLGFEGGIGHVYNTTTGFDEFSFTTPDDPEALYPGNTFLVGEDGTTYLKSEDGRDYLVIE